MGLRIDPLHAAGDYTAGDLSAEESQAFEAALGHHPGIGRETRFWQTARPAFRSLADAHPATARSWAPDRGFPDVLRQRLAWDRTRRGQAVILRAPVWMTVLASVATAAGLAALLLLSLERSSHAPAAAPAIAMFSEDGAEIIPPVSQQWATYAPRSEVASIDLADHAITNPCADCRSWMGIWTRTVALKRSGTACGTGQLVVRVVGGSPAYVAGLRPGDVISLLSGCTMDDQECLAAVLKDTKPGEAIPIDFIRPGTGQRFHRDMRLQTLYQ